MTTPQDWHALQRDLATFQEGLNNLYDAAMERFNKNDKSFLAGQALAYENVLIEFDCTMSQWVSEAVLAELERLGEQS